MESCPHCHDNSHAKDRKTKKNRKSTLKCRERQIVGEALARARLAEEVPCTASERVVGMDLQHRVQQHQSSAAAHAAFPAASQQPPDRQQLWLRDTVRRLPGRVARRWADYSSEEGSEAVEDVELEAEDWLAEEVQRTASQRVASTMMRLPARVARRWADYSSEEE